MWKVSREGQELVEVTGHGKGDMVEGNRGQNTRSLVKHVK